MRLSKLYCPICGKEAVKLGDRKWRCEGCKKTLEAQEVYSLKGTYMGILVHPEVVK